MKGSGTTDQCPRTKGTSSTDTPGSMGAEKGIRRQREDERLGMEESRYKGIMVECVRVEKVRMEGSE